MLVPRGDWNPHPMRGNIHALTTTPIRLPLPLTPRGKVPFCVLGFVVQHFFPQILVTYLDQFLKCWFSPPPPIIPMSTVHVRSCSVMSFLLEHHRGRPPGQWELITLRLSFRFKLGLQYVSLGVPQGLQQFRQIISLT